MFVVFEEVPLLNRAKSRHTPIYSILFSPSLQLEILNKDNVYRLLPGHFLFDLSMVHGLNITEGHGNMPSVRTCVFHLVTH